MSEKATTLKLSDDAEKEWLSQQWSAVDNHNQHLMKMRETDHKYTSRINATNHVIIAANLTLIICLVTITAKLLSLV